MTEEENVETPGVLGSDPAPETTEPQETSDDGGWGSLVESLPEELRGNETIQNTKSLESMASQLVNAQSALGTKRIEQPKEDWGDEEWDKWYDNIRPQDDTYKIPEVAIEGVETIPELTNESQDELVQFAGEMGLSQRQFNKLYQRYIELGVQGDNITKEQTAATIKEQRQSIQMDWGENYDNNLKQANAAYEALSQEIPEIKDLVESNAGVANHPAVLKLFHKIADSTRDALPPAANNPASGFANDTVHGVKTAIQELDEQHAQLIMGDPSSMSMAERTKRQEVLNKRTALYSQLYPDG
tara:strand:+ start:286 stop:1185 length:900 start_codon:yes stop_codon:yes gene_type:complete